MTRIGFYPGSFDPVTFGHTDIITRAAAMVDTLVVGVGVHHGKAALLDERTRVELLDAIATPIAAATAAEIVISTFDDLAVAAARRHGATVIFRGLRDASDFDYEVQMSQMNAAMESAIDTVFLAANPATRMIASSLVKQIARMGGDISSFVPVEAKNAIEKALSP